MIHYVYIIESVSGIWYYGYSSDPDWRLVEHNAGHNVSTRGRGPWKLIFKRKFEQQIDALAFEKLLKKTRNQKRVSSSLKAGPPLLLTLVKIIYASSSYLLPLKYNRQL